MRGLRLAVTLLTALASGAGAQILDKPIAQRDPALWVSAAIGLFDLATIDDGRTASRWNFGTAAQLRATLEYPIGRGSALGLSGTWARTPLRYDGATPAGALVSADAHADVASLMAIFRGGGGLGLHQVIEVSAGLVRFSNFSADDDRGALGPSGADTDLAFTLGGGLGYTLGTRAQIILVQDFGVVLHQGDQLPNNASTTAQHRTTRIGLRYGFGGRART